MGVIVKVLSLFDGMSCLQIALNNLGIAPDKYYASEIDKHAMQVTQHNFPNTIQLGDITRWHEWDINWGEIDLLVAGFPCQSWSFAGKGKGIDDPRGQLVFSLIEIWNKCRESNNNLVFIFENVVMKGEYKDYLTKMFGVSPVMINSSLVSAQNRKRLYWSNIPITQPEDLGITWKDVREHGLNKYYYTEKAMQWLGRHSRRKGKTLDVWANHDKAQMVEASHHKKYSSQRFFGVVDWPTDEQVIASMRGRRVNVFGKREDYNKGIPVEQYLEFRYDSKSNCLTTVGKDNVVVPFTRPNRVPVEEFFFRYISPVECERLQTVPDGYSDVVSDTQRYRMLGNGFTVKVIEHILNDGMNMLTSDSL